MKTAQFPANQKHHQQHDSENALDVKNPSEPGSAPAGIHLRVFEKVVSRILSHSGPTFLAPNVIGRKNNQTRCPSSWPMNMYSSLSCNCNDSIPGLSDALNDAKWPFTGLPLAASVASPLVGLQGDRANKKHGQIRSIIKCVYSILPTVLSSLRNDETIRIVDFCGGSGHVAIPLALLLSRAQIRAQVLVVDLKRESLELMQRRALAVMGTERLPVSSSLKRHELQVTAIPNLVTFCGDVTSFDQHFHIGLALHACGEATDVVLRACVQQRAAFVLAPCCVGKLSTNAFDPYVYHATKQNIPTITYPQSSYFRDVDALHITQQEYNDLAKAADYSSECDIQTPRNAIRRAAKSCIEWDRLCFVKEAAPEYTVLLTKMEPIWSSPKNDVLVGWIKHEPTSDDQQSMMVSETSTIIESSLDCELNHEDSTTAALNDLTWAVQHLNLEALQCDFRSDFVEKVNGDASAARRMSISEKNTNNENACSEPMQQVATEFGSSFTLTSSTMEWSEEEEESVRNVIESFCTDSEQTAYNFPPGQGSRMRKLVHHIADVYGLSHRSVGKQGSKRFVSVAKKVPQ